MWYGLSTTLDDDVGGRSIDGSPFHHTITRRATAGRVRFFRQRRVGTPVGCSAAGVKVTPGNEVKLCIFTRRGRR